MANAVTSPTNSPTTASASGPIQPFQTASLYVGDIHPDVTEVLVKFYIFKCIISLNSQSGSAF